MTPVLLLSDSYLANCAEPMLLPDPDTLPDISVQTAVTPPEFAPYRRDPATLARPWVIPGMRGMEHRIGGLEKEDVSGMVSYDAVNHQKMVHLRAQKIDGIADDIPLAEVVGEQEGELLIVGWGSTQGAIAAAVDELRRDGKSVSHLHLRYLNPFPKNLAEVLSRFRTLLVPENNLGQLSTLLRAKYPVLPEPFTKVDGRPFLIREIRAKVEEILSRDQCHTCG
jgi:2-oxoglutarate ferredoxin oxidoreductase subunit alpha